MPLSLLADAGLPRRRRQFDRGGVLTGGKPDSLAQNYGIHLMMLNGFETLLPFIAVAFTMWATPGPNNMMLAYSGARFGAVKTLPHVFGILSGTMLLSTIGILALKPVIDSWPQSLLILKIVGSFWLVRIGWKMASATRGSSAGSEEHPMSFLAALLFQFTNPKAITATVALASLVLVPTKNNPWLLGTVLLIIPPLSFLANGPWALAGQAMRRFLSTPVRWRIFTLATGALTAVCSVFLWI
jgi:threonine/homoserine/homoserine lactone efflux protein